MKTKYLTSKFKENGKVYYRWDSISSGPSGCFTINLLPEYRDSIDWELTAKKMLNKNIIEYPS